MLHCHAFLVDSVLGPVRMLVCIWAVIRMTFTTSPLILFTLHVCACLLLPGRCSPVGPDTLACSELSGIFLCFVCVFSTRGACKSFKNQNILQRIPSSLQSTSTQLQLHFPLQPTLTHSSPLRPTSDSHAPFNSTPTRHQPNIHLTPRIYSCFVCVFSAHGAFESLNSTHHLTLHVACVVSLLHISILHEVCL